LRGKSAITKGSEGILATAALGVGSDRLYRRGGLEVAQTRGVVAKSLRRTSSKMEERRESKGGYREPQDAAWSSRQPGYDEI
jgi:hypothetical protein